jgi:hypothetical protein
MKYMLIMQLNPAAFDALTEEQRKEIMEGHGAFMDAIKASGEMVETDALGEPSQSAVVRVRDGVPVVTDGPYLESKEFMGGYYIVDCATRERALELAALIPDAAVEGLPDGLRWVHFVDGLYDAAIPLAASGDAGLSEIFPASFFSGGFAKKFGRCLSRMEELLGDATVRGGSGGSLSKL